MSNKQLTIWFTKDGDMLDDGGWNSNNRYGYKSEDAKDFDDRMEYLSLQDHSRRAARVYFKSVTSGRKYSMYLNDFAKVLKNKKFNNNEIEGTFHFVKKSSGQAVQLVLPEDKP